MSLLIQLLSDLQKTSEAIQKGVYSVTAIPTYRFYKLYDNYNAILAWSECFKEESQFQNKLLVVSHCDKLACIWHLLLITY